MPQFRDHAIGGCAAPADTYPRFPIRPIQPRVTAEEKGSAEEMAPENDAFLSVTPKCSVKAARLARFIGVYTDNWADRLAAAHGGQYPGRRRLRRVPGSASASQLGR